MAKRKLLHKIIEKREEILEIAKKFGVENVRIFGSVASGTENAGSDIDLLVDHVKKDNGEDEDESGYIRFAFEVAKLFKRRKVECCTSENLHPRFKERVLKNCISIMEDNPEFLKESKRDYIINVGKSLKWIENYKEFIKDYKKEDIINNIRIRGSFRSIIQQPLEEMVRFVPIELRKTIAPDVDWKKVTKLRNFIVHHYDNVKWGGMWIIAKEVLLDLEKGCKEIMEFLEDRERKEKKKKKKG